MSRDPLPLPLRRDSPITLLVVSCGTYIHVSASLVVKVIDHAIRFAARMAKFFFF